MTLRIRIASRKSNLAIRQVEILKEHLSKDIDINIIEVVTSGDKILDKSLADIGGKGLFIKELENTILKDKADVAVHSMKDMETELAANTKIAGVLPRGSRSDVLLGAIFYLR
jgi:hydroxymethylbilane synthase